MSSVWYLMRGSGLVSLILLTVVVALGFATADRRTVGRLPRFVTLSLHRSTSLLAVVFLAIHVGTAIIDPYASIRIVDAFVPFMAGRYPLAAGLGAIALDLILALVVTSLLRERIGLRAWRVVHRAAYALWPVAFLHGLLIGTDRMSTWMLGVELACAAIVTGSIVLRRRPVRHEGALQRVPA